MSAGKRKWRMRWWMWLAAAAASLRYGWYLLPHASVYYPDSAVGEIEIIWDTNGRLSENGIYPGGSTTEFFGVGRDEGYYVEFYWKPKGGRYHCISITPNWPRTVIYLDQNADIDYSKGTDAELISKCPNDWADM